MWASRHENAIPGAPPDAKPRPDLAARPGPLTDGQGHPVSEGPAYESIAIRIVAFTALSMFMAFKLIAPRVRVVSPQDEVAKPGATPAEASCVKSVQVASP